MLTPSQMADEADVPLWRVWRALARGDIRADLHRGRWRVARQDWYAFLDD